MTTDPRIITLAAFFKRRLPAFRRATREDILRLVTWYWRDARAGVVRENGRIVAAALARCVNADEDAEKPFLHDEAGRIVWVEHIVSLHPLGLVALMQMVTRRFGPREVLAGHVSKRAGELRKLPWKSVERLIEAQQHAHEHTRSATTGRA